MIQGEARGWVTVSLRPYPVGLRMANSQDAEAVKRKMAFERIMDGDYAVLLPCSICLVFDSPLLLYSLLSSGNLKWADQNTSHGVGPWGLNSKGLGTEGGFRL